MNYISDTSLPFNKRIGGTINKTLFELLILHFFTPQIFLDLLEELENELGADMKHTRKLLDIAAEF